ncbi:hypothetical protein Tsubulata_022631 [Turnera subulata]|uniref:CCHC-type domain-containing protein n=1 Tax=Turnera subulata TaxID=218843 RepID=A0A9Q0JJL2_9ROSI|nr:hypothetical protein Tsubulata_022631 [Turnera subulata]
MAASTSSSRLEKGANQENVDPNADVLFLEDLDSEVVEPRFFLLAKVLGTKHLNPKAFTNMLRGLWNPTKGMEITQLERSLFLIQFSAKRDLHSVLKGEPWTFDKRLILLKQVTGDEHFSSVHINSCSFWVKIFHIPMSYRTDRHLMLIAGRLGTFCGFDERGALGWGQYVRVWVALNIDLPLKKEITSRSSQSNNLVFSVKYENLPNYCYGCGLIGHLIRECSAWSDSDSEDEKEYPFGDGLRASPSKAFYSQVHKVSPQKRLPRTHSTTTTAAPSLNLGPAQLPPVSTDTLIKLVARALNLDHLNTTPAPPSPTPTHIPPPSSPLSYQNLPPGDLSTASTTIPTSFHPTSPPPVHAIHTAITTPPTTQCKTSVVITPVISSSSTICLPQTLLSVPSTLMPEPLTLSPPLPKTNAPSQPPIPPPSSGKYTRSITSHSPLNPFILRPILFLSPT